MPQLIIPSYPTFCPFSFDIKDDYEAIYDKYEPYSEFYFENLAIWLNLNGNLEVSKLNNNIILRFSTPDEPDKLLCGVYGDSLIDETFNKILSQKQPLGKNSTKIDIVPEFTLNALMQKSRFDITEDRDNWEYIYSTANHSKLETSEYATNRYKVRRFIKEHGHDSKVSPANIYQKNTVDNLKQFMDKTNTDKTHDNDKAGTESKALDKTFKFFKQFDTKCLLLTTNGEISGFVIYYLSHNKNAILSNIKVDYKYKNIFDFMFYTLASYLKTINIEFINFEQDLGINGIRAHKMMLKPNRYLKKYIVSMK